LKFEASSVIELKSNSLESQWKRCRVWFII